MTGTVLKTCSPLKDIALLKFIKNECPAEISQMMEDLQPSHVQIRQAKGIKPFHVEFFIAISDLVPSINAGTAHKITSFDKISDAGCKIFGWY